MRGDVALSLRLLARPDALGGLIAAISGCVALASAYLPWYEVAATLDLLGVTDARGVANLAGWQAHPWGFLVPLLSLVAIVAGIATAVDRPLPIRRDIVLYSGLGLAATVIAGGLLFPTVSRFDVAGSRLRELAALSGRLPEDVDLSFAVRPAVGLWLTLAASALLVITSFVMRQADGR